MKSLFTNLSAKHRFKPALNFIFSFVMLGFSVTSLAQNYQVSGRVTQQNAEPLAGVSIHVKSSTSWTQTDLNGYYTLDLPKGKHSIEFRYLTAQPILKTIDLNADFVLDLVINETTEILDEVLVNAVRVGSSSPITHSNITKEELEKRNLGQDIPMLLNFLPSVVTTTDAGAGVGYTGIRVRGINAQSTNITINGIPYNDAESMGTFWVNLSDFASSTESMQLQRGVGTSTNGSGAFGASINVLSEGISNDASAEIANSFGSYNTHKHTLKFSTGRLNNHFEVSGRLSNIKSDGYIDRASSDLKSYFLQGAYVDTNRLIKAVIFGGKEITYQAWNGLEDLDLLENDRTFNTAGMYTDADGNIQFYDNEIDDYSQDHYQLHWNERINDNWSTTLGLNYTQGSGFFEQYKEDQKLVQYGMETIELGGESITRSDLVRRRWLDNDFYVINANASYKNESLNLAFGTSFSTYDGDHFGEVIWAQYAGNSPKGHRYYEGNGKKTDASMFTKATYRIDEQWSFYGDLQYRNVGYKTTGTNSDQELMEIDETYNFFNPKMGLTLQFNPANALYFSYARANREPSRKDFQNNTDVKPEQLNDYELGWRHDAEAFRINTNLYYMAYNEQLVLTGEIDDTGNPIRTNNGDSYRLGLEIEAAVKLSSQWRLQPSVTFSSNKTKETVIERDGILVDLGKTNISFSPEIVASNALVYQPKDYFQISLSSKYVGEQFMGNSDSERSKLDAYFINDLNLTYEWILKSRGESQKKPIIKSILFSGLVNNIFNKKYVSNGFYYTYDDNWTDPDQVTTIEGAGYFPQATTNFLIGATLKL
ncbi:TonB-dependent receptor [Gelidibacter mesophilus]|uniref:TonB-dependent receptor n=1 Tax=Gelidibacter mesophilus TaxID=169050 RepID=UPI00041C9D85|nr:TonB-dependent receptor [Gelidibacter mesophilus]